MHPSRRAYVEEEPQVSLYCQHPSYSALLFTIYNKARLPLGSNSDKRAPNTDGYG